jgi:hypothetical protein
MKILLAIAVSSVFFFQRKEFYEVLGESSLSEINAYILEDVTEGEKGKAYKAALYMRRAEYLSGSFKKLESFKKGRDLLDNVIASTPKNVEFRFLRLMVQEAAPWFLGYNGEIAEDASLIIDELPYQQRKLQTVILEYSKYSNALKDHL